MLVSNMRAANEKSSSQNRRVADTNELHAVLDLGSNSFHLMILSQNQGVLEVFERAKERVQLAHDMKHGELSAESMARGFGCLARFAQRLRALPPDNIRVVATSALREASNRRVFVRKAQDILSQKISIISGEEEARLICLGVDGVLPRGGLGRCERRLVVDIGGGSTEFGGGDASGASQFSSVRLGCVALSDACVSDATTPAGGYARARAMATSILRESAPGFQQEFGALAWHQVLGTSGTIESILKVLAANGWAPDEITAEGLQQLEAGMLEGRWIMELAVPGLERERADIFPAGVAILAAVFDALNLESMQFVPATLLEGVFFDRFRMPQQLSRGGGIRGRNVAGFAQRFSPDPQQIRRVLKTAHSLLHGVSHSWDLDHEDCEDMLSWAVNLHEIGRKIAPALYHRHGAYMVQNGDLWGFSQLEKQALALLIRSHRRGFQALSFRAFEETQSRRLTHLCVLLRLAVILERGRCDDSSPQVSAVADGAVLSVHLPPDWLADNALSARELEVEKTQLEGIGIDLEVVQGDT